MLPVWTRISIPVFAIIYVYSNVWTVNSHIAVRVSLVIIAPVTVPVAVMGVIMIVPVRMVPVVIMPVMSSPGAPVTGIVTPGPG